MSNVLTKLSATVQSGEDREWVPGTSGNPAYCIDTTQTVQGGSWIVIPANPPDRPVSEIRWVPGPPHQVIVTTCYPAVAGTPGYYNITPNYVTDYQLGWTGAARSIDSLTADGKYQFTVPAGVVGVVTGFNQRDEGPSYVEMEHGLYLHSGQFQVMEGGTPKTSGRAYDSNDVFTIARVGGQIRYYQDSTLIYVSARLSSGTIFVDSSLYAAGDRIIDASLTTTTTGFLPGSTPPVEAGEESTTTRVEGVLRGLTGNAADSNGGYVNAGPVPGAPGVDSSTTGEVDPLTGDWVGRIGGTLRMLTGAATGNFYGNFNAGTVEESPLPDASGPGAPDPLTGDWPGRLGGTLRMLTGSAFGSDGDGTDYCMVSGRLSGLAGGGDANGLVPEFVIVDAVLAELQGFSTALAGTAGQCTGYLRGLEGFASNSTGAYVGSGPGPGVPGHTGPEDPLTGDWEGRTGGVLRNLIGVAFDETWLTEGYENTGFLILPSLRMAGFGSTPVIWGPDGEPRYRYGLEGEIPALSLAAYGGGWAGATLALPSLTLAITGTYTTVGGLAASLPALELAITGAYVITGGTSTSTGFATLPSLFLTAYGVSGGAEFGTAAGALALPALALTATATAAGLASGAMELPALELVITGTVRRLAALAASLPALRMVSGGTFTARLPALHMRALAIVSVTVEDVAYEAYSFTLMPQDDGEIGTAPTRYTDYPFERIVRFMNHYYGVGVNGIYLLEGDTFDGHPIIAVVETGSEDFDRGNLKRFEALWFAGRCGADMNVSAISAELEEPVYSYTPDKMGARTQRVEFGRGTEARYWAFRFSNIRGEDFEVEQATPEITVLKRTHGGPS